MIRNHLLYSQFRPLAKLDSTCPILIPGGQVTFASHVGATLYEVALTCWNIWVPKATSGHSTFASVGSGPFMALGLDSQAGRACRRLRGSATCGDRVSKAFQAGSVSLGIEAWKGLRTERATEILGAEGSIYSVYLPAVEVSYSTQHPNFHSTRNQTSGTSMTLGSVGQGIITCRVPHSPCNPDRPRTIARSLRSAKKTA